MAGNGTPRIVQSLKSLARRHGRSMEQEVREVGALTRALNSNLAAYDTLFVELAVRERRPLVTFDAKLLSTFPDVAVRPHRVAK